MHVLQSIEKQQPSDCNEKHKRCSQHHQEEMEILPLHPPIGEAELLQPQAQGWLYSGPDSQGCSWQKQPALADWRPSQHDWALCLTALPQQWCASLFLVSRLHKSNKSVQVYRNSNRAKLAQEKFWSYSWADMQHLQVWEDFKSAKSQRESDTKQKQSAKACPRSPLQNTFPKFM